MTAQLALDFDPQPPSGPPWKKWRDRQGREVFGRFLRYTTDGRTAEEAAWLEVLIVWDDGPCHRVERYGREPWPAAEGLGTTEERAAFRWRHEVTIYGDPVRQGQGPTVEAALAAARASR